MEKYIATGLMSGTSMDGVDIATVVFSCMDENTRFEVIRADFYPYSVEMRARLDNAMTLSGYELTVLDHDLGVAFADFIGDHLSSQEERPMLIGSHGHTVFHQPEKGISLQIGDGEVIHARHRIPVVHQFRKLHTLTGGQGAPLAPYGDFTLFPEYDMLINLGGFSNATVNKTPPIAFDIGPCNLILNRAAGKFGLLFDDNGELGQQGEMDENFANLLAQHFPAPELPVSYGRESLADIFTYIDHHDARNCLHTAYQFIGTSIGAVINKYAYTGCIMLSGGGANNRYLIEMIQNNCTAKIVIPSAVILNFKEAIIFAWLGVQRYRREINIFSSATGGETMSAGIIIDNFTE